MVIISKRVYQRCDCWLTNPTEYNSSRRRHIRKQVHQWLNDWLTDIGERFDSSLMHAQIVIIEHFDQWVNRSCVANIAKHASCPPTYPSVFICKRVYQRLNCSWITNLAKCFDGSSTPILVFIPKCFDQRFNCQFTNLDKRLDSSLAYVSIPISKRFDQWLYRSNITDLAKSPNHATTLFPVIIFKQSGQ